MNRNRAFFLLLLAAVGVLSVLVTLPYLQYILLGVLLAYVLRPLHRRLSPHIGSQLSAGALILLTIFVVLLPIAMLVSVVIGQIWGLLNRIRNGNLEYSFVEGLIERYLGVSVDLQELLQSFTGDGQTGLFDGVVGILGGISNAAIGLAVLLFVLYYLLKDGSRLVAWLRKVTPLPEDVLDDLFSELDRLMWAVLVGNVLVALVQGILTGIGFVIVGLPNAIFWTVMTTALSLLPLIGASVIWIPASVYLFATGSTVDAVLLFVYGSLVISLSDNYLRPLIGGHEARLNPGLFLVGIFGGIGAFGFVGVFYGPIVLGALKALIDIYTEVGDRLDFMSSAVESRPRE